MSASLDRDAHSLTAGETPLEGFRIGGDPPFFYDLGAFGIEEAQVAVAVTEIQTGSDGARVRHGQSSFLGLSVEAIDPLQAIVQGTARGVGLLISSVEKVGVGPVSSLKHLETKSKTLQNGDLKPLNGGQKEVRGCFSTAWILLTPPEPRG